ncbi:MAG: hypothetical protein WBZ33_11005 [Thermoactinomyces sp.]
MAWKIKEIEVPQMSDKELKELKASELQERISKLLTQLIFADDPKEYAEIDRQIRDAVYEMRFRLEEQE